MCIWQWTMFANPRNSAPIKMNFTGIFKGSWVY